MTYESARQFFEGLQGRADSSRAVDTPLIDFILEVERRA